MNETTLAQADNPGGRTTVTLELSEDGALRVVYHDVGATAERTFGDTDYEAWLQIPPDQVARLAFALLQERLGGHLDALTRLRAFAEAAGVRVEAGAWT